ncbi:hypothetical protein [Nonomuraea sp. NPDC049141]|uniref:hypothetical protein n=1 Tax=Nonomuraea sp. NPDC049141 TaxID=3155500 RepID=UPI0033DF0581
MRRTLTALATLAAAGAMVVIPLTTAHAAGAVPHNAPTARSGEVIACQQVSAELPTVFGQNCDTSHWGPLSDFVIVDPSSRASYRCESGWAEGSLWVRGQDCQRAASS